MFIYLLLSISQARCACSIAVVKAASILDFWLDTRPESPVENKLNINLTHRMEINRNFPVFYTKILVILLMQQFYTHFFSRCFCCILRKIIYSKHCDIICKVRLIFS